MRPLFQIIRQTLHLLLSDIRDLSLEAWAWIKRYRWVILPFLAIVLIAAFFILPHDAAWLAQIRANDSETHKKLAEELSYWGDFPTGIILAFAVIWILSLLFKSPKWRRIAVAFVLASAVGGLTVNTFRSTLGRPRPSSGLPDGLYGLKNGSEYHAFPSGHSATSFATAGTFIIAVPQLGVPLTAVASGIGWSRMKLNRHHPTDILVGGYIGLIAGLAFGSAVRKLNKNAK